MRTWMNIFFAVTAIMFLDNAAAQGPEWEWTRQITGPGQEDVVVYPIAADNNNNVYVVGSYDNDTLIFTGDTAFYDYNSGFIARYDGAGNFKWAQTFNAIPTGVATNAAGEIYVAGFFSGGILAVDTCMLANSSNGTGFRDGFIAKLDSNGHALWLAQCGGEFNESILGISLDGSNDIFVDGYFDSPQLICGNDSVALGCGAGSAGAFFVAKLNPSGKPLWLRTATAGCAQYTAAGGLATDNKGNVFVAGLIESDSVVLGNNTLYNYNTGSSDIFLVKYDTAGSVMWANQVSGYSFEEASSVAADSLGHVYLTGYFYSDTAYFGPDTVFNQTPNTNNGSGNQNFFIARYNDATGIIEWVQTSGDNGNSIGQGLAIDTGNNVYVTSTYGAGGFGLGNIFTPMPADSLIAACVFKMDTAGNTTCADMVTDWNSACVCTNRNGKVFAGGSLGRGVLNTFGGGIVFTHGQNSFISAYSCQYLATGITPVAPQGSLQILPNPFAQQATVQYAVTGNAQNAMLVIYNVLGQALYTYPIRSNTGSISISGSNLSSGVYLLGLLAGGNLQASTKLVVE